MCKFETIDPVAPKPGAYPGEGGGALGDSAPRVTKGVQKRKGKEERKEKRKRKRKEKEDRKEGEKREKMTHPP